MVQKLKKVITVSLQVLVVVACGLAGAGVMILLYMRLGVN